MKAVLVLFLLSTPAFSATWIQAPGGVLPKDTSLGAYESEMLCGAECVDISEIVSLGASKIVGKKAVTDEAKIEALQAARDAAEVAAIAAKAQEKSDNDTQKLAIKAIDNATTVAQLKAVLKAIVKLQKLDQ